MGEKAFTVAQKKMSTVCIERFIKTELNLKMLKHHLILLLFSV